MRTAAEETDAPTAADVDPSDVGSSDVGSSGVDTSGVDTSGADSSGVDPLREADIFTDSHKATEQAILLAAWASTAAVISSSDIPLMGVAPMAFWAQTFMP